MSGERSIARLRAVLVAAAAAEETVTYRELARVLGFQPPGSIRRTADLLESTMVEDAAARRPFLAAVVVSRAERIPRRGFFERARREGRFHGEPDGPEARTFFESEFREALSYWGRTD